MDMEQLDLSAFFSDTSEEFVSPSQPLPGQQVTVRFRTAREGADCVICVVDGQETVMSLSVTDDLFDWYHCCFTLGEQKVSYHFVVWAGDKRICFDTRGVVERPEGEFDFVLLPGFSTPEWAKGAVMYQIFVDRFCNGDQTNDVLTDEYIYIKERVHRVEDWNRYPAPMDVREFYGGDLQGVIDKLDYLQDLGVEVIYFNPLFVSPSNHKYDTQDYDYIDPHIGKIVTEQEEAPEQLQEGLLQPGQTENCLARRYINRVTAKANLEASNELFRELVEQAHSRGIRVILDGVFNHCGSFHKWMDRERIYEQAEGYEAGAFLESTSPYRERFAFQDPEGWPCNESYKGWWDHNTLPKLNYEGSKALFDYVMEVGRKWVSPPYNADGWRLDVAADLGFTPEYNHYFWKSFRKAVKEANPEAVILAEHYGTTRAWLQGDEWDSVMNYDAFMEPVTWFLTGMEKHSDAFRQDNLGNQENFWNAMKYHSASFAMPSWQIAMNQLSNHDHSRFLTRTNRKVGRIESLGCEAAGQDVNKAVFREAVVMQMTWMGAPTIYYGDEAGVCGFTDPDSRRTYPWGREDQQLIAFHRDIIRLRREHPELRTGSIKYVDADYNLLAFARFRGRECCLILINNNDYAVTRQISVWQVGVPRQGCMQRLLLTDAEGYTLEEKTYDVQEGRITLELPRTCGMILKYGCGK